MNYQNVILITGAGAGIGRELARRLALRGEIVYACHRNKKRAEADYADLAHLENLRLLKLDLTRATDIKNGARKVLKEAGRVDVLVNNAGYGLYGAFEELDPDDFRTQMETNFFGAMDLARGVIPGMRERGRGKILNITSILGRITIPTGSAYSASKWALEAFSEVLRHELDAFGVQVVAIEPGLIKTNFKANTKFTAAGIAANSPYAHINEFFDREYRGMYSSVESCVTRIIKIMDKKNPAARYRVGLDARILQVVRRLAPEALMDGLVRFFLRRAARKYKKTHASP